MNKIKVCFTNKSLEFCFTIVTNGRPEVLASQLFTFSFLLVMTWGVVVWEANEDSTSISSLNLVLNALMAVSHVGFCVKFSVTFIHSGDFSESCKGSYFMQIYFLC